MATFRTSLLWSLVMTRSTLLFKGAAAAFAAMVFAAAAFGASAQAQANPGAVEMTVSPTKQELSLTPGTQSDGSFKVFNSGDSPFTFRLYAAPYSVANEQYDPNFENETNRTQISRWINVSDAEVSLQPGEDTEIPYTVAVPDDIPNGGQYAVIFAETAEEETDRDAAIIAKKRVGMLVYGRADGDTRDGGEIVSQETKRWQHGAPLSTNWRVENTGNTDFEVTSQLTVSALFGDVVYESEPRENVLLPDTTRSLDLQWDDARFGIYKVETTVQFLDTERTEARYVLVASPIVVVIAAAALVALIGGIVYGARKKRR